MALFLRMRLFHQQRLDVRRNRVFRDRLNPLDAYDDLEIVARYRLSRQLIMSLYDNIGADLEPSTARNSSIPGMLQIFTALRFYACGSYQTVVGDSVGVHKSSVCRIVQKVTDRLVQLRNQYILFPSTRNAIQETKEGFHPLGQFPNVVGAIDGTLISVKAPSVNEHLYVSGGHSINVLAVCDSKLLFTYVVAKYPGATNDAFIWAHCSLKQKFVNGELEGAWLLGDSG